MLLTNEYYENVKDYLHPIIQTFVSHYRDRNIIRFPNYHVCNYKNKNRNRKIIKYELGEQSINPTDKRCWKKTKDKYKHGHLNNKRQYWTRRKDAYLKLKVTLFTIINLKNMNIWQKH